jgi:hypothetical protein
MPTSLFFSKLRWIERLYVAIVAIEPEMSPLARGPSGFLLAQDNRGLTGGLSIPASSLYHPVRVDTVFSSVSPVMSRIDHRRPKF